MVESTSNAVSSHAARDSCYEVVEPKPVAVTHLQPTGGTNRLTHLIRMVLYPLLGFEY